jgi:UDP-2,4-diacetamido-2,4,6-trideoxy-beta-L-altropyranose hydrolase
MSYALMREEFFLLKDRAAAREKLNNLMVFFGGYDRINATMTLLEAIQSSSISMFKSVDVIVGSQNPYKNQVRSFCDNNSICTYHEQISNMAELMLNADLFIGSGGSVTWERIFLGLPSVVFSVADNQVKIAEYLGQLGYIDYLGKIENLDSSELLKVLKNYSDSTYLLKDKSGSLLTLSSSRLNELVDQLLD